ncbi:MAG: helix-turn-helix transcriptional regulator [Deltaproteobacteria bacterium]|nr:helix-turn-helix transcriptional regulator [Deltaproteobacteria bacterium]
MSIGPPQEPEPLKRVMQRAGYEYLCRWLEANPGSTMDTVCDALHTNRAQVSRLCRVFDTTFQALIDGIRERAATTALLRGDPCKVIAHRLGYADASAFFRAFKRWTGRTTGEWLAAQNPR